MTQRHAIASAIVDNERVLSESLIVGYYHNEPHEVCALGVKQQEPLWATAHSNGKKPALTFRKDSESERRLP